MFLSFVKGFWAILGLLLPRSPKNLLLTYLNTCVMIPIGPSRAPRGMSRPVSSCSCSGIRSLLVSSLGRVASRMSPVVCFEVFGVHTVLYLTGQIIPFFTNTRTEEVFPQFKPGGRDEEKREKKNRMIN